MSNKILVTIIIIILVLLGGGAAFYKYRSNKANQEFKNQDMQSYTQNSEKQSGEGSDTPVQPTSVPTSTPPEAVAGSTTTTATSNSGKCVRNFDENKLKTAKVGISGRQVEINVKDFGKITLEFFDKDAPRTVENFLRLTNSGYFDCLTFHRVAKGFVIQGGDPDGTGRGGISAFGEKFEDELNPETPSYKTGYVKGVLAMANSGPNTNGSQFFILLADQTSWMPHNYTIFGRVLSGQNTVDKIGQVPIKDPEDKDGPPVTPVVMQSVKIVK